MPTLEWIGKEKVINHHQEVPFRVLDKRYTFNAEESENMIIHGDNLLALKSLLPQYEGRVDCIYIDPPYNTGKPEGKWVYNDNVNDPRIKKWLGEVVGPEGEDLSRHDKWLCMMYPRLKLLHKLLAKSGVIFISIDDNEYTSLKIICDNIFGLSNYIGTFKWNRVAKAPSLSYSIRTKYEYVLLYKKQEIIKLYGKQSYNDMGPLWHLPNKQAELIFAAGSIKIPKSFKAGCYSEKYKVELLDDVISENGFNKDNVRIKACSAWGQQKIDDYIRNGNKFVVKKSFSTVYTVKNDLNDSFIAPSDLISDEECGVKRNTEAHEELLKMGIDFDYSKPVSLIEYLLNIIVHFNHNAIILDSFAGSGTTAHAVLNMNKQDEGNRKFILVEMMDYAETITAERVKRVIHSYGEGDKAVEGTGGDFTYYELGEPLLIKDELNENVPESKIREYIYYSETKEHIEVKNDEPHYLGSYADTAYYFYYEKLRTTTLNREFLHTIKTKAVNYVIYADLCTLSDSELNKYHITFKKIPRDITKF